MKEITLNKKDYLRSSVMSATVDEVGLQFKNGVALAKIYLTFQGTPWQKQATYECYGLIDENYHEVFADSELVERNLMALPYNKNAIRIGENNFIIEVSCSNEGGYWKEYRHVRLENGKVMMVNNNIAVPLLTAHENLLISKRLDGQQLYDVTKGEYVTPLLSSIVDSEVNADVLDVALRIDASGINKYAITEYLFFKINTEGKRVSEVISSLEGMLPDLPDALSIEELTSIRTEALATKEAELQTTLRTFGKDTNYLETYAEDLKRTLKSNNQ